ncbi:MAG: DCC1-like thiol-disulfide oxidoreductase family protein [Candidatus Sulfotelmatobacter sp.]
MPHPILLYDGVCGLCNRFVQFILRRDHDANFRFAWLQSALAARILAHHGVNPGDLDTLYVVVDHELYPDPSKDESDLDSAQPNQYLLSRSDAVLFVLKQLGGLWRPFAFLLQLLPKSLRNLAYNTVARRRYRLFGRSEVCILPEDHDHSRFLDGQ